MARLKVAAIWHSHPNPEYKPGGDEPVAVLVKGRTCGDCRGRGKVKRGEVMTQGENELLISKVIERVEVAAAELRADIAKMMRAWWLGNGKSVAELPTEELASEELARPDKGTEFNPPFDESGQHIPHIDVASLNPSPLRAIVEADQATIAILQRRYHFLVRLFVEAHQDGQGITLEREFDLKQSILRVKAEACQKGANIVPEENDPTVEISPGQALLMGELGARNKVIEEQNARAAVAPATAASIVPSPPRKRVRKKEATGARKKR